MNFGELKSNILSVIGRAPADVCYELTTADVNQELRLYQMETEATVPESATVSLPANFLDMVSIYRDTSPRSFLEPKPVHTLQRIFRQSGIPQFYAVEDGQLRLSPSPNGSENLVLRYYAKLDELSADSDTNRVLTDYPSVYVYGVLTHHALLIRDDKGLSSWAQAYNEAKKQARRQSAKYRSGTGSPVPVVRSVG